MLVQHSKITHWEIGISKMTLVKSVKLAAATLVAAFGLTLAARAQIFVVDNERVEREAAAYKDFNLQTNEMREQIVQRRQYIARGGQLEAQLAELEKQKAIIGNDKYEADKRTLEQTYVRFQQELQYLEYAFDEVRKEALVQVERARQPVIREILKNRNAQIILPKRLVLGNAAGLDVTTEFIELLDAQLPSVTLTKLPQNAPAEQPADESGN
jgi:Skp family chaperone for outer membrane proteins